MAETPTVDAAAAQVALPGAPGRWALAVFGVALSVYLLTATYSGPTIFDVASSSIQAWGLGTTGQPWLENSSDPAAVERALESYKFVGVFSDHVVASRAVGTWLFAAPFYAVLGDPESYSLAAGAVAAAGISALGVLWMYLAVFRLVPNAYALAGAAVYAFGIPTWSVSADGLWGHTITQAALAGAALAAAKNRMWLAGLAFVPAILARAHTSIVAAVLGTGLALSRRSWAPLASVGLPAGAGLAILVLLNGHIFGRYTVGGAYSDAALRLSTGVAGQPEQVGFAGNVAGFLASPGRGVLVYTPLLLMLAPGAARAWRSCPDWVRWLATGGLLYAAAQVWIAVFNGGDAYAAYRLGLETVTCLVPLYVVAAYRSSTRLATAAVGVAVIQMGLTLLGATVNQPLVVEGTEWTDNDALVVARGAPGLSAGYWSAVVAIAVLAAYAAHRRLRSQRQPTSHPKTASPQDDAGTDRP